MLKQYLKEIVVFLEYRFVRKLLKHNKSLKIVAVSGSIGKTSTKRAIAIVLSEKYKVQWQDGNYNDIVSVPMVFFGQSMPSLFNPIAWTGRLIQMQKMVKSYPYEIVVLELGTDGPGQIKRFKDYFSNDIAVITPIAPEHMEYFESIDQVAREEISISDFSKRIIVHESLKKSYDKLIDKKYLTYGESKSSDAYISGEHDTWIQTSSERYKVSSDIIGRHQKINLSAACLVAENFGLSKADIESGLAKIKPLAGRMNKLKGINSSVIIDDTYNSSPKAVEAALATLKVIDSDQKIAVLGNMNELGYDSPGLHREVGKLCSPDYIDLLITIGADSNRYLAEEAESNSCKVMKFNSPFKVGQYLKDNISPNAVVLLKGSQNGVFLEEAIKSILADPNDESKLVRQSKYWLKKKKAMFK